MEIKGTCKRFVYRVMMDSISSALLLIAGLTYGMMKDVLILISSIFIPISLLGFIMDFFREKYYVTLLLCDNETVYVEYYRFDKMLKETFSLKEFDLLYGGEFRGRTSATALIFRRNRKKILKQYQGGVWTKDKMVELYEYIRKEKLKNIKKY